MTLYPPSECERADTCISERAENEQHLHWREHQAELLKESEAENDLLKVQYAEERQAFLAEQVAGQEARSENERLRAAVAWNEEQRGIQAKEIKRLRVADKYAHKTVERLDAEVERLRAALEGVIAEADRKTAAFDTARAALGQRTMNDD